MLLFRPVLSRGVANDTSSFTRGISIMRTKRMWESPSRPLLMWKTLTLYGFEIDVGVRQHLIRHFLGLGYHH